MSDSKPQVTAIPYDLTKYKRTQELVVGDRVIAPIMCGEYEGAATVTAIVASGFDFIVTYFDGEFYDQVAAEGDIGWEMAQ